MIWYKDNKPLKDDYRIDIYNNRGTSYLRICDAKKDDSGDYAIFSKNHMNDRFCLTRVIVNENLQKNYKILEHPDIKGFSTKNSRYWSKMI